MPDTDLNDFLNAARQAGYGDAEIRSELANRGYAASQIDSLLGQQSLVAAQPMTGWARYPALVGSEALRGAETVLGLPGVAERSMLNVLGLQNEPNLFPLPQDITAASGRLGLTQRADLVPSTPVERFLAAGASGLGAAAPLTAMGPAGQAVPALVAGAAGGVAGQAAHELALGPTAEAGAGLAAGVGTLGLSSVLGRSISSIARDLGTSSTMQEAGQELKSGAQAWLDSEMPRREAAAWAPVDAAIPAQSPVPLNSFEQTLSDITGKGGQLADAVKLLRPRLPDQLSKAITRATLSGTDPSWSDVRALRTSLGKAMSEPKIAADVGQENLRNLYRAVTEDLGSTAHQLGAGDLFNSANSVSTYLHGVAEGPIASIVEAERPEDAAVKLLSGARRGGTDLTTLRREIPDAVDELAAAHLRLNPDARAWSRFSPEAQDALVTNPDDQRIIGGTAAYRPPGPVAGSVHTLAGLGIGGALGAIGGHEFLPAVHPLVAQSVGELAGASLPWIWRGARGAAQNPFLPAVGAIAGQVPNQ